MESLHTQGRIRREHLDAAEEIRRIWQAFSRGLGPTAVNPIALALPSRSVRTPFQPVELLSASEEAIWRHRYAPWAKHAAQTGCGGSGVTSLRLVLELAVENRSLRQTEDLFRLRHGAAVDHLRDGLQCYAVIAGWVAGD